MKTENKRIAASAISLYLSLTLLFIEIAFIKSNIFIMSINDVLLPAKGAIAVTALITISIAGTFFFLKHDNHKLTINFLMTLTIVTAIYFTLGILPNALQNA